MKNEFTIVGVGEILFDRFGDECVAGGAPFNFAYYAKSLGMNGIVASRIGRDPLGYRLRDVVLPAMGMSTSCLQEDEEHPTGTVEVKLDDAGNAEYTIIEDVAWDYLQWTPELEALAHRADAVCFGTLAQRTQDAREAIDKFVEIARDEHALVFLDVNLRGNYYNADLLRRCCLAADILKMNEAELIIAQTMLGRDRMSEEEFIADLINTYHMEIVCLTRGTEGCILFTTHDKIVSPGFRVQVKDTVGAGDAFSAGLLVKFLEGASLRQMAAYANLCGAYVATQHGGTPPISREIIRNFRRQFRHP